MVRWLRQKNLEGLIEIIKQIVFLFEAISLLSLSFLCKHRVCELVSVFEETGVHFFENV